MSSLRYAADTLGQIPPEWRPFVALAVLALVFLYLRKKGYVDGHAVSKDDIVAVQERVDHLDDQISNHLATAVQNLADAVKSLDVAVRRQGDIQIASSRVLNELVRVDNIIADRMRMDRIQSQKLPETRGEADDFRFSG